MAVLSTILYEGIISLRPHLVASGNSLNPKQVTNGDLWVVFDAHTQGIELKAMDDISIESNEPHLNGIYRVKQVRPSRDGYTEALFTYRKEGFKLREKTKDWSAVTGRIYFGKRNVKTTAGGTATQVLNNDVFKVMLGRGLLIITSLAAYSFFGGK